MKTAYAFGLAVGVILGAIILLITKTDKRVRAKYDERQEKARGTAYKLGFFTLLFLNFVYPIAELLEIDLPFTAGAFNYISLCIAIMVFAVYSIFHGAYYALNENTRAVLFVLAAVGAVNVLSGVIGIVHGTVIEDGKLSGQCLNLAIGVMLIIVFAASFIKFLLDKKEEADEES